jgi:hypothetical protein
MLSYDVSQSKKEQLVLDADCWEQQPSVWQNFVNHVNCEHPTHSHRQMLENLKIAFKSWDLELDGDQIIGSEESYVKWYLTFV